MNSPVLKKLRALHPMLSRLRPRVFVATLMLLFLEPLGGCGLRQKGAERDRQFFTSGSRDADQRAGQRMAQSEQLTGPEGARRTEVNSAGGPTVRVEGKLALFDRLGGSEGLEAIVNDFVPRALQDPRVNWSRKGTRKRIRLWRTADESAQWLPSAENVTQLKERIIQFLALVTGGPVHYEGKALKATHDGMRITNPEFDAVIGDMKASLDKLRIPNKEQKELLAVIESTRPQIVTVR